MDKVNCKYLTNDNLCAAVLESGEAKTARLTACESDKETACCYLCSLQETCDISCSYLGEIQVGIRQSQEEHADKKVKSVQVLRCPYCGLKMRPARTRLRIGGWEGWTKGAVRIALGDTASELGEIEEETLPVVIYFCPQCGRMEFMAEEKTKQKLLKLFDMGLM